MLLSYKAVPAAIRLYDSRWTPTLSADGVAEGKQREFHKFEML